MNLNANFSFDGNIINQLARSYRSTAEAIKELVTNAWDAEAEEVYINIPQQLEDDIILIEDNGNGMTPNEVQSDFLNIGVNRKLRRGDLTPKKKRKIKGERGIGKFSTLLLGNRLFVETKSRGQKTSFEITRSQIESFTSNMQNFKLALNVENSNNSQTGTIVKIEKLRRELFHPDKEIIAKILVREFGIVDDFSIFINDDKLTIDSVPGKIEEYELDVPEVGKISLKLIISESKKPVPEPGIIIRVKGRTIGKPTFFGLDKTGKFSKSVLAKICGEVNVDYLEDDITSDWAAFIEDSKGFQELQKVASKSIEEKILSLQEKETKTLENEILESHRNEIEKLPLPKRELARRSILKVLRKYYTEEKNKIITLVSVVLRAFEEDTYWFILKKLESIDTNDTKSLAEILELWGFHEISGITQQSQERLKMLEMFEVIINDQDALELQHVHKILEKNTWILGEDFELLKSNKSLRNTIQTYLNKKYTGERGKKRPDLFLINSMSKYLLVELKRPSKTINRQDMAQVQEYVDELKTYHLGDYSFMVLGGSIESSMLSDTKIKEYAFSYSELLRKARERLDWILNTLSSEARMATEELGKVMADDWIKTN